MRSSGRAIRFGLGIAAFGLALLVGVSVRAQEELPLYELDPYDEMSLDEENGSAVMKIMPLEMQVRRPLAQRPAPETKLRVRLFAQPDKPFDVEWKHIVKLRLYEQILVEEAERLASEGRFDEAYNYFAYLLEKHPKWPGLGESIERYLINDAFAAFQAGDTLRAWALLVELHRRNPQRAGLAGAVDRVGRKRFDDFLAVEDYASAGALLTSIEQIFGASQAALVKACRDSLAARAAELRTEIAAKIQGGDPRAAVQLARELLQVDSRTEASRTAWVQAQAAWPQVVVAVTDAGSGDATSRWATERIARLEGRMLLEPQAPAAEGLRYAAPLGSLKLADDGRGVEWLAGGAPPDPLRGWQVGRLLRAESENSGAPGAWRSLVAEVEVLGSGSAAARLRRGHPRVESLLASLRWPEDSGMAAYRRNEEASEGVASWVKRDDYLLAATGMPRAIVEVRFTDSAAAADALLRGKVDAVDWLWPRQAATLSQTGGVVVNGYPLPAVHVLVPARGHALLAKRRFRRALLHALDRGGLLREHLQAGVLDPAAQVAATPLPTMLLAEAPAAIPFEPRLAATLIELAKRDTAAGPMNEELLVLAGPADATTQTLLAAMQTQFLAAGIPCALAQENPELEPNLTYARWNVREPAVDLRPLLTEALGAEGIDPALDQALRSLETADSISRGREALRELATALAGEVPVLPLWQLSDFYARSAALRGFDDRPMLFYQQVEAWKLELPEAAP